MLHHLVHGHHQEDDIELSKQRRIRVNRLHLERHPIPDANTDRYVSHRLAAALEILLNLYRFGLDSEHQHWRTFTEGNMKI